MIKNWILVLFIFSLFFLVMERVSAEINPVEFRFVCDGPAPECSKEIAKRTGEELWVENKSVFDIDDIESASVNSQPEFVDGIQVGEKVYSIRIDFKDLIKVEDVTSRNIGKRLGVFIDGKLIIAPLIVESIIGGKLEISVAPYEDREIKRWVDFINNSLQTK